MKTKERVKIENKFGESVPYGVLAENQEAYQGTAI